MNEVNEQTGVYLLGFAHRLSGRIGAIRQYVSFIKDDLSDVLMQNAQATADFDKIKTLISDIVEMIPELQNDHRCAQEYREFGIEALLDQAIGRIRLPDNIQLSVLWNLEHTVVQASAALIDVVQNLVQNAINAMPHGGVLQIVVTQLTDPPRIKIKFIDSGLGMPDHIRETVFKERITTQSGIEHGTGLLWSIQYLRGIGGDLVLETTGVNMGTVVTMYLRL